MKPIKELPWKSSQHDALDSRERMASGGIVCLFDDKRLGIYPRSKYTTGFLEADDALELAREILKLHESAPQPTPVAVAFDASKDIEEPPQAFLDRIRKSYFTLSWNDYERLCALASEAPEVDKAYTFKSEDWVLTAIDKAQRLLSQAQGPQGEIGLGPHDPGVPSYEHGFNQLKAYLNVNNVLYVLERQSARAMSPTLEFTWRGQPLNIEYWPGPKPWSLFTGDENTDIAPRFFETMDGVIKALSAMSPNAVPNESPKPALTGSLGNDAVQWGFNLLLEYLNDPVNSKEHGHPTALRNDGDIVGIFFKWCDQHIQLKFHTGECPWHVMRGGTDGVFGCLAEPYRKCRNIADVVILLYRLEKEHHGLVLVPKVEHPPTAEHLLEAQTGFDKLRTYLQNNYGGALNVSAWYSTVPMRGDFQWWGDRYEVSYTPHIDGPRWLLKGPQEDIRGTSVNMLLARLHHTAFESVRKLQETATLGWEQDKDTSVKQLVDAIDKLVNRLGPGDAR